MEIFHVLSVAPDLIALRLIDDNMLNFLVSASSLEYDSRLLKNKDLIRKKAKLLFADSGLLGFIKQGKAWDYATQPDKVLEIQLSINPDIVATLDHPCEPSILTKSGTNVETAISLTVYNALWLVEGKEKGKNELKNKKIAIVVQGYEPKDYEICIRQYKKLGFFDLNPEEYWFAIGSVCMRKPPELYEIVEFVRKRIPEKFHVHCFGIANPLWVLKIKEYGINSVDSATGSVAGGFFAFIDEGGRRRKLKLRERNKYMAGAMIVFNWLSLETQIKQNIKPELILFEES